MKLHYIIAPISKDNFCMHGCNDENTIFYLAYIETYFLCHDIYAMKFDTRKSRIE